MAKETKGTLKEPDLHYQTWAFNNKFYEAMGAQANLYQAFEEVYERRPNDSAWKEVKQIFRSIGRALDKAEFHKHELYVAYRRLNGNPLRDETMYLIRVPKKGKRRKARKKS